jgi:hypothetical protein
MQTAQNYYLSTNNISLVAKISVRGVGAGYILQWRGSTLCKLDQVFLPSVDNPFGQRCVISNSLDAFDDVF